MHARHQAPWTLMVLLLPLAGVLAGCSGGDQSSDLQTVTMARVEQLPVAVQRAPASVRQAYQFAVANPAILSQVPCYCGCGSVGHTSVHSCYVASATAGQPLRYDGHALGCSICVDIVLDALRLTRQGNGPGLIRTYVDMTYAKFGRSNMS